MDKIIITINTTNAAFEDEKELANILYKLANDAENGALSCIVRDSNGNKVGIVTVE